MQVSIDRLLLRRRELALLTNTLEQVRKADMFKEVLKRNRVMNADFDDVSLEIPKLSKPDVDHTFDWHARTLRIVDAVVQRANWATKVAIPAEVMNDYTEDAPLETGNLVDVELAQLLTRRKDLEIKMGALNTIKRADVYERKEKRIALADSIDDLRKGVETVPVLTVLHAFNWYNRQYHECDWAIHKANTETLVEIDASAMGEYPGQK